MIKYLRGIHIITDVLKMCINGMDEKVAYFGDFSVEMCKILRFLHG